MAEQSSNIIKHLLGIGLTVTINHTIDEDTAEYLVKEFGHTPLREQKTDEIIDKIIEDKNENKKVYNFYNSIFSPRLISIGWKHKLSIWSKLWRISC